MRSHNGLWVYEKENFDVTANESIEYWLSVEYFNLGYYMNKVVRVQDIMPEAELKTFGDMTTTAPLTTPVSIQTTKPADCEASVTTVNGKSVGCKNSIIFNEDFNSDNLKHWSFDTRFSDSAADAEFNVYEKRNETSYIRDGILVLKSELMTKLNTFDDTRIRIGNYNLQERCTPILTGNERECERQGSFGYILPPVTSSYLTTRNKFSFMYGKVQIRCRVARGDWLYSQILLQPIVSETTSLNSSRHLKILFVRGNENLVDGQDNVGGSRVYGGAVLSKNVKNNEKWLKSKEFPNDHLGNEFHVYELLWTPSQISLSIDGKSYGSLQSTLRESAIEAKIKSAVNWANNGPFDKEHFLSIMVAAGSVKNFYSINSSMVNGAEQKEKPWSDTDPRAEYSFYLARDKWYPTWIKPTLEVDYIKIFSV
ncbi:CLUMA_CG011118, isoform A [Clunio marinus]|uniref:CLUMA_CG011118, isoform A n=1 Tax=Clunio marinus TaxID=568069 RepID=A0A1J1IDA9_9DIPT|nr:CLUMA_CG011118, isoform A [Clunio marinus]